VTQTMLIILDVSAIAVTLLAALLWWKASGAKLRRMTLHEELNALDINRIIVSINRSQQLNMRAAIASALSAMIIAMRFAAGMIPG
jgi:Tfp pilus assembly pilus retraction ATPase PilT